MKNTVKLFGIITLLAIIAFAFVACELIDDDDPGTLTITGIPSKYNGKYAYSEGGIGTTYIIAADSFSNSSGFKNKKIENGTVTLNVWTYTGGLSLSNYGGSGTGDIDFEIYDDILGDDHFHTEYFKDVKFTGGNATVQWE